MWSRADRERSGSRKSSSDVARDRAAVRDMAPAMITLVVLQGSLNLLDPSGPVSPWYVGWSLSPLIPALWLMWAQLRSLRRADEYQRVMQLEAMAIGFGAVIMLSLAGGLLDGAGIGEPRQWLQLTSIVGVLAWAGALTIKTSRAR